MPLDDVWKTIGRTIGIHHKGSFEDLPPVSGVYAWFYPLRVRSYDLDEFLSEVRSVHLYDARNRDRPAVGGTTRLGWSRLDWSVSLNNPDSGLSDSLAGTWQSLVDTPEEFEELRKTLLRASLLMPPLYVGKAVNLRNRCYQHLKGRSQFSERFNSRAVELELNCRNVGDLLLVTVQTEEVGTGTPEVEDLVEEILKSVCRPPYGVI